MSLSKSEFMLDCTLQAKAGFGSLARWTDQPVGGSNPGSTSPTLRSPHVKILWKTIGILVCCGWINESENMSLAYLVELGGGKQATWNFGTR